MTACPSEIELTRAQACGSDAGLDAHVASCAACRDVWTRTARAIELARELPVEVPSAAHREEVRTALLASLAADRAEPVADRTRRRIAMSGGAIGFAACLALVVVWRPRPTPNAHGSVHAIAGAHYELAAPTPDERVVLHDGTIAIDVEPLAAGERFRVVVGEDEVEVVGTSFEVSARVDHLVGVRVVHGRVEVRPAHQPATVLGAGQAWTETVATRPSVEPSRRADIAAPAPPAPTVIAREAQPTSPQPPRTPPHQVIAAPPAPAPPLVAAARLPEELAYDDAWDALRTGAFHRASAAFGRALALAPDGPLADDARYWHAVSLARERRVADAIAAFRELLDEHAGGAHRGEAGVMLGWLLVDDRQRDEARTRFRTALADPAVHDKAVEGLAALAR